MQFSADIKKDDAFPVIILKDKTQKTEVTVYTFGALLNSFLIDGKQNIIEGFSNANDVIENITNGFKSAKLSPFVCRIKNGKYVFKNKNYTAGKFFLGKESIHGLLYDALFNITNTGADNNAAFVKLEYVYSKKEEGFPFAYSCEVVYTLHQNNKLSVATIITNKSDEEMPLSDGWHPYFTFNQTVNNLSLTINADTILEFDETLVPTGKLLPFNQFQSLEKLGDNVFDNCFQLKDTSNVACVIEDEKNKLRLSILPSNNYPYLQVYTPPHRNSIAIENLSSAPDAFNNKMGLIILQPNEQKTFETSYQAIFF